MLFRLDVFFLLLAAVVLPGCGSGVDLDESDLDQMAGGSRKETVAVSGKVTISGSPAGDVVIYAYPKQGGVKPAAETRTADDGSYCWTTYVGCDGLPTGEYQLAFVHAPKEGKGKKTGEDKLEGRYKDPMKSEFSLSVASGKPQIDVNYDLK